MKIIFACSEMVPFAKTGGLAEVTATLASEFRKQGQDITVFLPYYKAVHLDPAITELVLEGLRIDLGSEQETGKVYRSKTADGIPVYFIEHKLFFNREELYGPVLQDYPDNDRRFLFFQKAVLEALKLLKIKPDVIHCHDWQTGMIPVFIKTLYAKDAFFQKTKTVFTIHNLAYQGNFPPDSMPLTNLDWGHFTMDRLEFYGKLSFIKGGIVDSDVVTTVSQRYAREIQTKEFGCNLEGVLIEQREKLQGIINGIDSVTWDPSNASDLPAAFNAQALEGKARCKAVLQQENGLDLNPKAPIAAVVSRLVEQKGIDLVVECLGRMMELGFQFILLGTGEEKYHRVLREMGRKRRSQCSIHILFDARMAKRIYAGSDFLLVPSYYEPCGLSQMIGLRYGTIPIVRATGGLADTIQSFDGKTLKGNGFVFENYHTAALAAVIEKGLEVYQNPKVWTRLVQNAMACDYSWTASAKKYLQLYETTARLPGPSPRKG